MGAEHLVDVEGMAVLHDRRGVDAGERPRLLGLGDDGLEQLEPPSGVGEPALRHVGVGANDSFT